MKREVSLEEISDGRLYEAGDLVKADCGGCAGCSACCRGMGKSVILDPLDAARLSAGAGRSVEQMLALGWLELGVVDGVILPNLNMPEDGACPFLDNGGRCSVHPYRPGICRLFPLGRYYFDEKERGFRYFLQVHECPYPRKTKIRVRKWIDTPDLKQYETYIADWHYFLADVQQSLSAAQDPQREKEANVYLLKLFYLAPFSEEAFYPEFYRRLEEARHKILAF